MQRVKCLTGVLLSAVLLTDCVNSRIHIPFSPNNFPASFASAVQVPSVFRYFHETIRPQKNRVEDEDVENYEIFKLGFPSAGENGQVNNLVSARYYESKLPGKKKLVIVLPIWGSHTYPSKKIAEGVVARSEGLTNVLLIAGDKDLVDWHALRDAEDEYTFKTLIQARMADRIKSMVIDTMRVIDWAETQPDIDQRRIGLIGFSIGAMIAGTAISVDPRISAGVLVMGGANPDEIIATCPGDPESVRQTVVKRFGWTAERYRALLREILAPYNPAHYPGAVDPRRVIIIDAYYDECVPGSAREALWRAMGQPERLSFMYSHKMAFMAMTPVGFNYMRTKIYDFLDRTL